MNKKIVLGVILAALLVTGWGCGRSASHAKTVSDLRTAGRPDSARSLAIHWLQEKPGQVAVWQEFVRASLDLCRSSEMVEDADAFEYLTEASLVCAAVYQVRIAKTDPVWLELGHLASSEMERQVGRLSSTFNSQEQSLSYLRSAVNSEPSDSNSLYVHESPLRALQRMMDDDRRNARKLLALSYAQLRILKALPEISAGANGELNVELEERIQSWGKQLELEDGFIGQVKNEARKKAEAALAHAAGDYSDLGYFLPVTILENGVLP